MGEPWDLMCVTNERAFGDDVRRSRASRREPITQMGDQCERAVSKDVRYDRAVALKTSASDLLGYNCR
jgi:hypothetical protein